MRRTPAAGRVSLPPSLEPGLGQPGRHRSALPRGETTWHKNSSSASATSAGGTQPPGGVHFFLSCRDKTPPLVPYGVAGPLLLVRDDSDAPAPPIAYLPGQRAVAAGAVSFPDVAPQDAARAVVRQGGQVTLSSAPLRGCGTRGGR